VKKSLGGKVIAELSDILYASIKYGLDHRAAGVEHALPLGRGLDRAMADKFIGMYVNELTLDYGERGKKGVREFLDRAHHAGLIPAPVELEFV
jgi:1,4-dihydroxy-6-naphthoate synthase